ncbi:MAG: hypothetical protein KAV87_13020 [Desulfobacteraceae bacterium]|nr:hypothetical protein [Desulfobacteraceae bacterium]
MSGVVTLTTEKREKARVDFESTHKKLCDAEDDIRRNWKGAGCHEQTPGRGCPTVFDEESQRWEKREFTQNELKEIYESKATGHSKMKRHG